MKNSVILLFGIAMIVAGSIGVVLAFQGTKITRGDVLVRGLNASIISSSTDNINGLDKIVYGIVANTNRTYIQVLDTMTHISTTYVKSGNTYVIADKLVFQYFYNFDIKDYEGNVTLFVNDFDTEFRFNIGVNESVFIVKDDIHISGDNITIVAKPSGKFKMELVTSNNSIIEYDVGNASIVVLKNNTLIINNLGNIVKRQFNVTKVIIKEGSRFKNLKIIYYDNVLPFYYRIWQIILSLTLVVGGIIVCIEYRKRKYDENKDS